MELDKQGFTSQATECSSKSQLPLGKLEWEFLSELVSQWKGIGFIKLANTTWTREVQRLIINTKNPLLRLYTVRVGRHWTSLTFVLSIQTVTVPTYVAGLSHLCVLSAWVPLVLSLTSSPAEWWQEPPSLLFSPSPPTMMCSPRISCTMVWLLSKALFHVTVNLCSLSVAC